MTIITPEFKKYIQKQGYRVVGNHSAVKVCHYTKSALNNKGFCYKRWYGIQSHRCVQMTPTLQFCNFQCIFCWRHHETDRFKTMGKWDKPEVIIDGCINAQRELLSGFGGNPNTSKEMFEEAMNPKHFAISLDGEPTLYPMLPELISEIKKRKMTAFLVTNGSMPEMIEKLLKDQPTNLYISLYGPDKETFEKISRPQISDAWERINRSLELLKKFDCNTVIRLTLVKGWNMKNPEGYAKLMLKANPKFVECKGYSWVGESRERLKEVNVPSMEDIRKFSVELAKVTRYEIIDEDKRSRVVLMKRKDVNLKIRKQI